MRYLYVILDVGCLECELGTSVLGVVDSQVEARRTAQARLREKGEDTTLEVPTEPSDPPAHPDTLLALAYYYGKQQSVEIHRVEDIR